MDYVYIREVFNFVVEKEEIAEKREKGLKKVERLIYLIRALERKGMDIHGEALKSYINRKFKLKKTKVIFVIDEHGVIKNFEILEEL